MFKSIVIALTALSISAFANAAGFAPPPPPGAFPPPPGVFPPAPGGFPPAPGGIPGHADLDGDGDSDVPPGIQDHDHDGDIDLSDAHRQGQLDFRRGVQERSIGAREDSGMDADDDKNEAADDDEGLENVPADDDELLKAIDKYHKKKSRARG